MNCMEGREGIQAEKKKNNIYFIVSSKECEKPFHITIIICHHYMAFVEFKKKKRNQ